MAHTTKDRLELRKLILELIDRRREESGDRNFGSSIEQLVIEEELHDLALKSAVHAVVPVRQRKQDHTSSQAS